MSDVVFDLNVVPEGANGRTVMEVDPASGNVVFTGQGRYTYGCGNCGEDLIVGAEPGDVGNVLIKCNNCGAINESPPPV
jgi:predicted RNA-binding Zn-ribbon protein involved in translation (DUF1610 family)